MSVPIPLAPTDDPDLRSLLNQVQANILYNFNCHQLGTINSFNAATQTASITLNVLRMVPDRTAQPPVYKQIPYPLLLDCPVFVPAGGDGYLAMPVAPGDTCLVLFNDRDIDVWFSTGGTAAPNSQRAHDLSDGLAIVGFRSKANPVANYPADRVRLAYGDTMLELAAKVRLLNADASLKSVLDSIITALTALNAKTGPSAAAQIILAQTEINKLTES